MSRENTREQPDHCSSARENRNTGLPYAQLKGKTLTSFARTPHDQLRTLPTQVAWGTSLLCLSRPTVQDGMSTQIENDLWSWYPCRSTVHYLWKFPWVTDPYRRHSWNPSLVEFPRVTDKWPKLLVTQGNFRKIDHFPVGDGFPWVTDNTRTCATRRERASPTDAEPSAASTILAA